MIVFFPWWVASHKKVQQSLFFLFIGFTNRDFKPLLIRSLRNSNLKHYYEVSTWENIISTDLLVIIESHWFLFTDPNAVTRYQPISPIIYEKLFLYLSYTTSFLYFQFMFLFYPKFGGKINHVKMQNGLSHF